MNLYNKLKLLPDALRGQLFCEPERNGEYRLLNETIKDGMIIFDVGANIGEYAEYISKLKNNLQYHCFEPSKNTFIKLQERLALSGEKNKYLFNNYGLSNTEEDLELNIYNETGGSNSLYFNEQFSDNKDIVKKERIHLRKLDDYIKENKINRIDFLKIDVEGHEFYVVKGAIEALEKGLIKSIQFEYNNYWLKSGAKLLDMLKFLNQFNYNFYRLTPWGKINIRSLKSRLENYKHSNYYAVKKFK